jgi:hypothetical protein
MKRKKNFFTYSKKIINKNVNKKKYIIPNRFLIKKKKIYF